MSFQMVMSHNQTAAECCITIENKRVTEQMDWIEKITGVISWLLSFKHLNGISLVVPLAKVVLWKILVIMIKEQWRSTLGGTGRPIIRSSVEALK